MKPFGAGLRDGENLENREHGRAARRDRAGRRTETRPKLHHESNVGKSTQIVERESPTE
jgi:hypothetical protein